MQVAIENGIGGITAAMAHEIHEQECQVIENVDGGDLVAELYGIKKDGTIVNDDNVAAVHVAMATAHQAFASAPVEQRFQALQRLFVESMKLQCFGWGEYVGRRRKGLRKLGAKPHHDVRTGHVAKWRIAMGFRRHGGEFCGQ